jgi:hypothetical protein
MDCKKLLQELLKEVVFDAHSTHISYGRSEAKREFFTRNWQECFKALGDCISRRQDKTMKEHILNNERETMSLLHLLYDLPESHECEQPYSRRVPYSDQQFGVWTIYCRKQENARSFKPIIEH